MIAAKSMTKISLHCIIFHMFDTGLFIFHRDFRIHDNIGLIQATQKCKQVYVCFIFTPDQVGATNHYRSTNAIQFMIESLEDLEKEIQKNRDAIMENRQHIAVMEDRMGFGSKKIGAMKE